MDNKKPSPLSHAARRKSTGSSQLRSPLAKRSPLAPVAQKGWLQKQGSEGLMLWKKRWCVLSEHCLFYYKTPEEEKILGSILLPSYKVSPCTPDDKIYRKFAFKVEHANMRTYVFAAETREAMVQWMNALSLSTILQDMMRRDDSGFPVTHQPERNVNTNGWVPQQPLYANAPPKPRRVAGEPSPEPSPDLRHYHPYQYQLPNGYVRGNPHAPNYQHPNQYYQGYHQLSSAHDPSLNNQHVPTTRRIYQPPRPHSADFLDYDAKKYYEYHETTVVKQTDVKMDAAVLPRQRPKSSMDIMQGDDERYYWSEERYAEKMRQSLMYLHQRIAETPGRSSDPQETFTRSASARLARQTPDDEGSDEVNNYMGGEESMKRLLEWKQRMLASPLTRKPSGSSGRGSAQNELSKYYKQQVQRELERQEARTREDCGRRRMRSRSSDGRRSAMSASNRYNSYSSDDEEKGNTPRERTRRPSQSGKLKKSYDDLKTSKTPKIITSPDYENLSHIPVVERSGRMSAPLAKNGRKPYKDDVVIEMPKSAECFSPPTTTEKVNIIRSQINYKDYSPLNENSGEKWSEKLDETKLIKEFSYQYINEKSPPAKVDPKCKLLETPPENIVKSRIKQLGLEGREDEQCDIVLKEPLQMSSSSYLLNEAHVSHLKSPDPLELCENKTNILRKFALGLEKNDDEKAEQELTDKNQKSVKDLLADFERKSQLAHEQFENEKSSEDCSAKRYVFSDTETLLYDTSSDTDDRKHVPNPAFLTSLRRPNCLVGSEEQTEEEGDEEVAAALGKRERYFSSCREIGRKQDTLFRAKKPLKPDDRRLSVTDSMVVNEDSESACSTPTIDMIKENLEKTLPKENIKTPEITTPEGHYMPMSPSRRTSAPPSDKSRSNSSLHSVLYGVDIEETYVEMSQDETTKLFVAKSHRKYDEAANKNNESHYDFLYKSSSHREPEYMEVNNVGAFKAEVSKEDLAPPTPPRSALPDILNSSAAPTAKSDSSDADDESSKDLDSLDPPSHPRFSLSDTFRPASYYLGNVMGTVVENHTCNENHDSSDSDLVSPPPIPTSPPPLEDLDTSLETENSLDLNSQPSTSRKLKISEQDSCKKLWSKPKSSQDYKRRPVSENILENFNDDSLSDTMPELDSIGNRSGFVLDEANGDINLDKYLEDLQLGERVNPQAYSKDFRSYGMQRNLCESFNKNDVADKNLLMLRYPEADAKPIKNDEVEYENLQAMFPPPPPELYESSDQSDRENGLALYRNVPPPANYCDVYDPPDRMDQPKIRFDPDTLQQKDSFDSQAPYYYSDTIKNGPDGTPVLLERNGQSTRPRHQPLNNQRDSSQEGIHGSKRNDVGRKVNAINHAPLPEVDDVSDVQRMAAELRSTTADFMGDADKTGSVDLRNVYESDTLQRRKAAIPVDLLRVRTPDLQHPQGIARNLYPHGLRDKGGENAPVEFQVNGSVQRNRSVEGLLEEAVRRPCGSPTYEADDLWDEDSLWRESLRRVSRSLDNLDESRGDTPIRERNNMPSGRNSAIPFPIRPLGTTPSGRRSVDACSMRPKLSRDVTYVNDVARRALLLEYEQDYREGRRLPKKQEQPQRVHELCDSEVQDCDDGVHYERLKRGDSESLERRRRGEVFTDRYDWDADQEMFRAAKEDESFLEDHPLPHIEPIDRERLRQWDLLSSGYVDEAKTPGPGLRDLEEGKVNSVAQGSFPAVAPQSSPQHSASEASASGSVMRENHARMGPPPEEGAPPRSALGTLHPQEGHMVQRQEEYDTRVQYYERGKSPIRNPASPSGGGGYPQWQDGYSYYPDDRHRNGYQDHRRPLADYNLDHRLTPQRHPYTGQPVPVGGTLPAVKPARAQSHAINGGRSVGTLPLSKNSPSSQSYYGYQQPREYHQPGKRDQQQQPCGPWGLDVSAGELLGRTHEELVLLLIQLRRQSAGVCKSMETCHTEIEAQARLAELDTPKRLEHLQKLEELKRHLLELEKQYEKGKPLVNLVDNMVKLGSLYRGNNSPSTSSFGVDGTGHVREKLEFNQKVQEQRLLAEERREWDRLSPDQNQLQEKVQQLYKLDRLLQEESGTLQNLQKDKELLEKALGGLRHKIQVSRGNPLEADRWRQQQKLLQKELSRVRQLLAHSSKKLEETVSENARLEQELVILRQKLQSTRLEGMARSTSSLLDSSTSSATQALESELRRVQTLVGDLQRQRQELSVQVRQLTEKNDTLVQQIRPGPTGVAGAGPIPGKKRPSGTWYETDLDYLDTQDLAVASPTSSPQHIPSPPKPSEGSRSTTPIYINTDLSRKDVTSPTLSIGKADMAPLTPVELSEADEKMKRYYGIIPREKQEIKTVRIVKRESERRQRDRDRSGNIGLPIGNTATAKRVAVVDEVDEEEFIESPNLQVTDPYAHLHPTNPFLPQNLAETQRSMSLPRGFGAKAPPPPVRQDHSNSLRSTLAKRNRVRFEPQNADWSESESGGNSPRAVEPPNNSRPLTAHQQLFGSARTPAAAPTEGRTSPSLSPVYQSEAAREIVQEMARRAVPKEKRRHHTVSNIRLVIDADRMGGSRARDDLDMERALRPRINAPDVVRSTLSQKDLKYNESTIDTILGTPNKIVIPERYIPENEPILTAEEQLHRLRKAESIRKMLSETSAVSSPDLSTETPEVEKKTATLRKKVEEEKKQREHLLQLNQILAQQVMEKSKLVAVKALAKLPLDTSVSYFDDDDLSPIQPLPLYQQRENFYS